MKKQVGKNIGIGIIGFFTFVFFAYVVIQYFILGPNRDAVFVSTKKGIHYHPWIIVLYIHIIFGSIALLTGAFQFNEKFRQNKKTFHKTIGKTYVSSVLIAFIAGLYLSFYGTGGLTGVIGFYTLEFAWIIPTVVGFIKIRKKDVKSHREWMVRSYAVTLTFVSFRIWSIPVVGFEGKPGVLFGLTIIFSWVVNLLIAEVIIMNSKRIEYILFTIRK